MLMKFLITKRKKEIDYQRRIKDKKIDGQLKRSSIQLITVSKGRQKLWTEKNRDNARNFHITKVMGIQIDSSYNIFSPINDK